MRKIVEEKKGRYSYRGKTVSPDIFFSVCAGYSDMQRPIYGSQNKASLLTRDSGAVGYEVRDYDNEIFLDD